MPANAAFECDLGRRMALSDPTLGITPVLLRWWHDVRCDLPSGAVVVVEVGVEVGACGVRAGSGGGGGGGSRGGDGGYRGAGTEEAADCSCERCDCDCGCDCDCNGCGCAGWKCCLRSGTELTRCTSIAVTDICCISVGISRAECRARTGVGTGAARAMLGALRWKGKGVASLYRVNWSNAFARRTFCASSRPIGAEGGV